MQEIESGSFITARAFACRLGCPLHTRNGNLTNHISFLGIVREHHPDTFPAHRWLGSRKVFLESEVSAFIASMPAEKVA